MKYNWRNNDMVEIGESNQKYGKSKNGASCQKKMSKINIWKCCLIFKGGRIVLYLIKDWGISYKTGKGLWACRGVRYRLFLESSRLHKLMGLLYQILNVLTKQKFDYGKNKNWRKL